MALREPLLAPSLALAAGVALSAAVEFRTGEAALLAAAFAALAVPRTRVRMLAALLAWCSAGILSERLHRPGPPPELDAAPGETLTLAGCVVEPSSFSPGRERFVLELEPGARVRVSLWAREGETLPALRYGERIELEARVRKPRNFKNSGAFDYAGYLARRDIFWVASAGASAPLRRIPGGCGSRAAAAIQNLRAFALERARSLWGEDPYSEAMLAAALVGESEAVDRLWTEGFRRTGTYHALVISGMHLTVLAGTLLLLLRWLPFGELPALAMTAAAGWLYALVSGASTPVVRAAAGLTLFLVARFFFRRTRMLNLLAAIAILFLLADPGQLFEASFQLSFLAVAALGALGFPWIEATSGPWRRGLRHLPDEGRDRHLEPRAAAFRVELRLTAEALEFLVRIPKRWGLRLLRAGCAAGFVFWETLAVSAAMQLAMILPMAYYFHRVSFTGLSANVLLAPLMALLIPLGFLAILTGWSAAGAACAGLLRLSAAIVEWHARLEPPWRVPDPALPASLAFAGTVVLLALGMRRGRRRLLPGAAAVLCAVLVLFWPATAPPPGKLTLTALDVGQGDSLLVDFPAGGAMLVDGGGLPAFQGARAPRLDVGEEVVSAYLWAQRRRRLDVVAATHGHADHAGGLPAILDNFRPRELWTGGTVSGPAWEAVLAAARRNGVRVAALHAGDRREFGGASIEVLWPEAGAGGGENDRSLVLAVRYGETRFLLTGDVERRAEARIRWPRAAVLKVPHHGARTSSTEALVEGARPAFAVLSVGEGNRFGHPGAEVLRRLAERRVAVLRTDQGGVVQVSSDGRRVTFERPSAASRAVSRGETGIY
jgi:competence protein ComEC